MAKINRYIPGSILHVNDLLPWFLEDHSTLPAAYLKSTQAFLDGLQVTSHKPRAGWARPIMYRAARKIIIDKG